MNDRVDKRCDRCELYSVTPMAVAAGLLLWWLFNELCKLF